MGKEMSWLTEYVFVWCSREAQNQFARSTKKLVCPCLNKKLIRWIIFTFQYTMRTKSFAFVSVITKKNNRYKLWPRESFVFINSCCDVNDNNTSIIYISVLFCPIIKFSDPSSCGRDAPRHKFRERASPARNWARCFSSACKSKPPPTINPSGEH